MIFKQPFKFALRMYAGHVSIKRYTVDPMTPNNNNNSKNNNETMSAIKNSDTGPRPETIAVSQSVKSSPQQLQ